MFRTERYDPEEHHAGSFDSGIEELDDWLRDHGGSADRAGTSRVYVWVGDDNAVVAYYATAPWVVSRDDVPASLSRGMPNNVPAILITKLALASELQGNGVGAVLLTDALRLALDAIRLVGGRVIFVDAINASAKRFYEHFGFKTSPDQEQRLFIKASTVARSLEVDWP